MKKMLALVFVVILFAVPAFAVSTLVCTDTKITFVSGVGHKVACTATADSTTYNTLEMKTAAGASINLAGQYLYLVSVVPGGTAPTDNSDLVINEDTSTGIDILSNSGLNMIDNATTNTWRPISGTVAYSAPIMGPLFVGASGNSVSGAIFILTIRTVPQSP
jgi:hypothetical protein